MTKQYWLEKIQAREKDLEDYTRGMENAGIANEGDWKNKIEKANRDIDYYRQQADQAPEKKRPNEVEIFLYVIVSFKSKVASIIGDDCYCFIEDDRYHDSDLTQWKPYAGERTIGELVDDLKESYPITTYYLDNDDDDYHAIKIEDNEDKTISIIDLLSIDEDNILFVKCFDRTKIGGVFLPKCRNITKYDEVHDYMKEKRISVFSKIHKRVNTQSELPLNFLFDLSEYQNFYRRLKGTIKTKFPIKNQSSEQNPIRNMNMNF